MSKMPFRVKWYSFWWGALHPFATDQEHLKAAVATTERYWPKELPSHD